MLCRKESKDVYFFSRANLPCLSDKIIENRLQNFVSLKQAVAASLIKNLLPLSRDEH